MCLRVEVHEDIELCRRVDVATALSPGPCAQQWVDTFSPPLFCSSYEFTRPGSLTLVSALTTKVEHWRHRVSVNTRSEGVEAE